jgi:hypothetical protein
MAFFKQPTFQERAALAAKAKEAALQKLREKPPIDEAVVAERIAARQAKLEAQAKAREEKIAAREREKAEKKAAAEAAAPPPPPPPLSEAEKKALRDARYAARKSRVGKK